MTQQEAVQKSEAKKPSRMALKPCEVALFLNKLPPSSREIVSVIGIEKSVILFTEFGGMSVVVPKSKFGKGAEKFKELESAIGLEYVVALRKHYGNFKLYIPYCLHSFNAVRNHRIKLIFDRLTKEMSAYQAMLKIRKKHRLSTRTLEDILNGES